MSIRIIGGEYKIDPTRREENEMYGTSHTLFASGRIALQYILKHAFGEKSATILLPDHICGSVPDAVKKAGMDSVFYTVQEDFMPLSESVFNRLDQADAVLLVNYFGMLSPSVMRDWIKEIRERKKEIIIILDNVQDYGGMQAELGQDYCFTSYRKWFPVPDGALIRWKNGDRYTELYPGAFETIETEPLFSKYKYAGNVLKNYRDIIGDEISLQLLTKGEEILEQDGAQRALQWTEETLKHLNIDEMLKRRKENAEILHKGLAELGIRHIYNPEATPLFVPILLENDRDSVRKKLFEESVFCPVHWGEAWKAGYHGVISNRLAESELSLICDHRYGEADMKRQLDIITKSIKKDI